MIEACATCDKPLRFCTCHQKSDILEDYAVKRGYNTGKHRRCFCCGVDIRPDTPHETYGGELYCLQCANQAWQDPVIKELRYSCELALEHCEQSIALLRAAIEKATT